MTSKVKLTLFAAAAVILSLAMIAPSQADQQREQARANFMQADVNQDRLLDFAEFKTFIDLNADHNIGRASMISRFGMHGRAFGTLDANRDGAVSPAELAAKARR